MAFKLFSQNIYMKFKLRSTLIVSNTINLQIRFRIQTSMRFDKKIGYNPHCIQTFIHFNTNIRKKRLSSKPRRINYI